MADGVVEEDVHLEVCVRRLMGVQPEQGLEELEHLVGVLVPAGGADVEGCRAGGSGCFGLVVLDGLSSLREVVGRV